MPSKVLFIGDVNGQFSEVFNKVRNLNTKHNFAFVVLAGNLCADPESETDEQKVDLSKLLNGDIEVSNTTYFSLGSRVLPPAVVEKLEANDGELSPNLFILGRKTTVKTSDGFKLVAVGGNYAASADEPMSPYEATFNDTDAQTAGKDIEQADILITSDWPAMIQHGTKQRYKGESVPGLQCISDLCTRLKPRYHFSTSKMYYDRDPFFQPGEMPRHITRFISLAPYGTKGEKNIYAFNIEPSQPPPKDLPEGCTPSPLSVKKRKLDSQQDSFNNFRYSSGGGDNGGRQHARRRKRGAESWVAPTLDECFFCLSNKKVQEEESHMITSVGDNSYMTIAKGPLPISSTFKQLGFPCHMLLLPIAHAATPQEIPETDNEREATLKELEQQRGALQKMIAARSRDADEVAQLGAVTFEIIRAGGMHFHWQFIPMPVSIINKSQVEAGFEVEAENLSYLKYAKGEQEVRDAKAGDYFRVMIWTETFQREMVMPLPTASKFDLQYGRKVLAKLLGLTSRFQWRDWQQSKEEETADATAFKEAFKDFDPFL